MKKSIYAIICFGILTFCGCYNINTDNICAPYNISIYEKGKPVKEFVVPTNSELEKVIDNFIKNNHNGWKPSFVTFAPNILIYGDTFSMNLQDSVTILNYSENKNKYRQITKKSNESTLKLQKMIFEYKE